MQFMPELTISTTLLIKMRIILLIAFFAILVYGCANTGNLELKTKSVAQELNQASAIGTQIGRTPPDFTAVTTEGVVVRLNGIIEKKKPVIVYFMATWCPYCARDYTALSQVYKNYENNVTMLSISLDLNEDLTVLREYKKKYPELKNAMFAAGQPQILADYDVIRTTTKYAVDRNGKIIYAGFGAFDEGQWKILLDELSKP